MKNNISKHILNDITHFSSTEKLYYKASYETTFSSDLIYIGKDKDKAFLLLDSTLFFPKEGGQTSDKGEITVYYNSKETILSISNVIILSINSNDYILHEISLVDYDLIKDIPLPTNVNGKINYKHRFSNMQNHTGEHMFSGVVNKMFQYNNVGFHLGDNNVTMDFDGELSTSDIEKVEKTVNYYITKNLPIRTYYPTADERSALKYRSKINIRSALRICEIEGVDRCACCAPHVHFTGEVGILIVISSEKYKGGTRLSILCGNRAFSYIKERQNILNTLSIKLKLNHTELYKGIEKLEKNNTVLKNDILSLTKNLIESKIKSLPTNVKNVCMIFNTELNIKLKQNYLNSLKEIYDYSCIVCISERNASFILGSNKSCENLLSNMKDLLKAKGGGNNNMVSGTFPIEKISLNLSMDKKTTTKYYIDNDIKKFFTKMDFYII